MDEKEKMEKMHQIDIFGLPGRTFEAKILRELEDIQKRLSRLEEEIGVIKKERR